MHGGSAVLRALGGHGEAASSPCSGREAGELKRELTCAWGPVRPHSPCWPYSLRRFPARAGAGACSRALVDLAWKGGSA